MTTNFTVLVQSLLDIIAMYLVFSNTYEKREKDFLRFYMPSLYGLIGPALGSEP